MGTQYKENIRFNNIRYRNSHIEASLGEEWEIGEIFFEGSKYLLARSRNECLRDQTESGITYLVELVLR